MSWNYDALCDRLNSQITNFVERRRSDLIQIRGTHGNGIVALYAALKMIDEVFDSQSWVELASQEEKRRHRQFFLNVFIHGVRHGYVTVSEASQLRLVSGLEFSSGRYLTNRVEEAKYLEFTSAISVQGRTNWFDLRAGLDVPASSWGWLANTFPFPRASSAWDSGLLGLLAGGAVPDVPGRENEMEVRSSPDEIRFNPVTSRSQRPRQNVRSNESCNARADLILDYLAYEAIEIYIYAKTMRGAEAFLSLGRTSLAEALRIMALRVLRLVNDQQVKWMLVAFQNTHSSEPFSAATVHEILNSYIANGRNASYRDQEYISQGISLELEAEAEWINSNMAEGIRVHNPHRHYIAAIRIGAMGPRGAAEALSREGQMDGSIERNALRIQEMTGGLSSRVRILPLSNIVAGRISKALESIRAGVAPMTNISPTRQRHANRSFTWEGLGLNNGASIQVDQDGAKISIRCNGKDVLRVLRTGHIEKGDGISNDEVTSTLWQAIESVWPQLRDAAGDNGMESMLRKEVESHKRQVAKANDDRSEAFKEIESYKKIAKSAQVEAAKFVEKSLGVVFPESLDARLKASLTKTMAVVDACELAQASGGAPGPIMEQVKIDAVVIMGRECKRIRGALLGLAEENKVLREVCQRIWGSVQKSGDRFVIAGADGKFIDPEPIIGGLLREDRSKYIAMVFDGPPAPAATRVVVPSMPPPPSEYAR